MAVILSFEEYRRLQDLAKREQAETRAKWRERFERLLAEVHRRTSQFSSEEIEAEITAASLGAKTACFEAITLSDPSSSDGL